MNVQQEGHRDRLRQSGYITKLVKKITETYKIGLTIQNAVRHKTLITYVQ